MEAASVKEQDAQVEAVQKDAAGHGLEDGEHVAVGIEEDMKLDVNESVGEERADAGKEDGSVTAVPAAVTDIEKKRRRAERFGTDLKISEAEKRKLRAARFNDGTKNGAAAAPAAVVVVEAGKVGAAKVPESVKCALMEAESAKRKARAERFGSTVEEVTVNPKFSKAEVTPKPKFSQDEEAKKKARMARFAMAAK